MSEVKVQVTYAVWAPDNASGDAAAKRMALRNEHGAYFDGWRTKGAILYGGAMTAQDIKLPISEAPDFTGSVIVLKADSLDDAWAIVKGDVYYQEGVWDKDNIEVVPALSRA